MTSPLSSTRLRPTPRKGDFRPSVPELAPWGGESSVRELRIDGDRPRKAVAGAARLHPRLLIVQPNPFRADVIATILAPLRLECHHAASNWTAVRWLAENPSAAIVAVDPTAHDCLGLPNFLLRQQPDFPVVALFTTTNDECEIEAMRRGAAAVLGYPCPPEELRSAVAGALLIRTAALEDSALEGRNSFGFGADGQADGGGRGDQRSLQSEQVNADHEKIKPLRQALHDYECLQILGALRAFDWNRNETARALGIERTTLYLKMRKYGLLSPDEDADELAPAR